MIEVEIMLETSQDGSECCLQFPSCDSPIHPGPWWFFLMPLKKNRRLQVSSSGSALLGAVSQQITADSNGGTGTRKFWISSGVFYHFCDSPCGVLKNWIRSWDCPLASFSCPNWMLEPTGIIWNTMEP